MKTKNQEMIQLFKEEGEYAPMYPIIAKSHLSDFQKVLITHMLNDISMNGYITWKHETYASKINASRMGVCRQFKVLVELGILIPLENNKAGSKNNKFEISFSAIDSYKPDNGVNSKPDNGVIRRPVIQQVSQPGILLEKPDNGVHKPDNGVHKPDNGVHKADNGVHKADNQDKHIKKDKENNKENNKESLKEPNFDDSFFDDIDIDTKVNYKTIETQEQPKKDISQDELEEFLANLDI